MAKNTSGPSNSSKPTTTTTTNSTYGTDSDDYIFDISGNDIVFANKGDDVINSGAGNDIVYVDDGKDVIIHNVNDNKGFKDYYDAGAGTDTLQLVGQRATIHVASDSMDTILDPNHLYEALYTGESLMIIASYTNSDESLTGSADQTITINGVTML